VKATLERSADIQSIGETIRVSYRVPSSLAYLLQLFGILDPERVNVMAKNGR
jgi:hypothetical protein